MLPDDFVILNDRRGMVSLLALLGPTSPALRAARAILELRERLLLCTGFPVGGASETDGPAGAIVLAQALSRLERPFTIVSWADALASWAPALSVFSCTALPRGAAGEPLDGAAVTIEVCGRTPNGAYLDMRGEDVSVDAPWFEDAIGTHALVSVGDGGNEFGMGSAPAAWFAARGVQRPLSTCSVLVPAQVSNWGVLAVLAAMSRLRGVDLLPTPEYYRDLLEMLARHGVVDGVTRVARASEDGFEPEHALHVIAELRRWLGGH